MGIYRDCFKSKNTVNPPTLVMKLNETNVIFEFLFYNGVHLKAEQIIDMVSQLQAWLDLGKNMPERKPLIFGNGKIACPYCGRKWDEPSGRKAGFIMSNIYRHVESCRLDTWSLPSQKAGEQP